MMSFIKESDFEQAALAWLEGLEYTILSGPDIAPGQPAAERDDYAQVILERRLRQALQRLNPSVPADAIEEAFRKLTRPDLPSLAATNHLIHKYLVEGVPVEYQRPDGSMGGYLVRVLDFDNPENNEFLAVNQFTVVEDRHERRPDIVLFINGLPLAVHELKNAADENATIWSAFSNSRSSRKSLQILDKRSWPS
jgi:type I restriction enzyme R subunit